jgi:nucleotide-binding universal stress UspA family protein
MPCGAEQFPLLCNQSRTFLATNIAAAAKEQNVGPTLASAVVLDRLKRPGQAPALLANHAASAYPVAHLRAAWEGLVAKAKVIVALRDAESVESLVTLACQLSSGMEAELIGLHVVEVPLATPLEADGVLDHPGKEILASAQEVAERFGRKITTQLLRAREVGEAIAGVARDQRAELLVMGHHKPHPHPLGELLLGSTVQYVAHHAPCRVVIQIPAPRR